ncbi:Hypothetical predicted protein [Pelobates cultripes]|uniref:Uncharacterized protein n=1 Tax=Pelobates cultripes TaxID=61616 RepID=A0AAD1QYJ0_PELCU|nr:Hypothetical predicted protein [Pelobates cultripes]
MREYAEAHNSIADTMQQLETRIEAYEAHATLRTRKTYQPVTAALSEQHILYHQGFPTKLLVNRNGTVTIITSPDEGLRILRQWNLSTGSISSFGFSPRKLRLEWHRLPNNSTAAIQP